MKKSLISIFFAASCVISTPSGAQQAGVGFDDAGDGGGTLLQLSANGTCWDDCWVQSSPLGEGTVIAVMKSGQVVDQGYVDAPLNVQSDAPAPPPSGTGSKSDSSSSTGWNSAGQPGAWVTTTTYTFSDHKLRNVESKTEWIPEMDPPADDGEG